MNATISDRIKEAISTFLHWVRDTIMQLTVLIYPLDGWRLIWMSNVWINNGAESPIGHRMQVWSHHK